MANQEAVLLQDHNKFVRALRGSILKTEMENKKENSMNLYALTQSENGGYDTYDACIVCANSEDDAKQITPDGDDWNEKCSSWASSPENVAVELIGKATDHIKRGVVIGSFNAGYKNNSDI